MLALLWIPGTLFAQGLYVSPNGSDITGDGSSTMPFKTLQKAINTCDLSTTWTIVLLDGTYEYSDTIKINTSLNNVESISAYNTKKAIIKNTIIKASIANANSNIFFLTPYT